MLRQYIQTTYFKLLGSEINDKASTFYDHVIKVIIYYVYQILKPLSSLTHL